MKKWIIIIFLFYMKISETIYYQRNREIILSTENDKNDKKRLRERAKNKCKELSEEKKIKKENMIEINIVIYLKKISKN